MSTVQPSLLTNVTPLPPCKDGTCSHCGPVKLVDLGADFLRGQASLPSTVWTKGGRVVERSEVRVFIADVIPGWSFREDYAREAKIA